jgi:RNA polymerase primary sigma factor
MNAYRNPALRQLMDQQVRFAPRDVRIQQMLQAERLFDELRPDAEYPYQDLCQRLTGYKPESYPDLSIPGDEAQHDLRLLIEDLSDSVDLKADAMPEEVYTVDQVSKRFNVSTKTVDRWRERGLVSFRLVFGNRKRIGFLASSLDRFARTHADDISRGAKFSQLSEVERDQIIERARRMARHGGCPSEISKRIARTMGRATETIRYTLKAYDETHPDAAIFPAAGPTMTDQGKADIMRLFREGQSVDEISRRFCRTKSSVYRIVTEMRARRLLELSIEFMAHPEFEAPDAELKILGPVPASDAKSTVAKAPPGLPPYLANLYSIPLLNKEQEVYHFRKMNYLKFRAARLRDQLDLSETKVQTIDEIERLLEEAGEVKNLLTRSNLRLVVSVAKKHVGPNGNFFEMISDGNMSLIRAIEKFDYGRGFKFSTYATWAIMKNFARSIPAEHTQQDRFRTGTDEMFMGSADRRGDQFGQELANRQQRDALATILDRLDERERNIIVQRYGLEQGTEPLTLEQLGDRFGVTKERIRQLEARALTKLRQIAVDEHLDVPGIN